MATAAHDRRVATHEEARRIFASPKRGSYDVVVVGGGSAGLSGAQLAAALGASVALVDRDKLGGECLYTGCVPSKALLHVARVAAQIRRAGEYGLRAQLAPVDLAAVSEYVQRSIAHIYADADAPENQARYGIDVVLGPVRFTGEDTLEVNGHSIRGRHFLIATGSQPRTPDIPGLREAGFLTNESVFNLQRLPGELVVLGGGPVGCELAQAFARLGSRVTLLQRPERLLPREEPAASEAVRARFEREGVRVVTRAAVTGVATRADKKAVVAAGPDGPVELAADEILAAVGRTPAVDGLDLERAGVRLDAQRGIAVDKRLRTSNPRIYAAGDVVGRPYFTHAAAQEARTAVRNMLFPGFASEDLDERALAWATFTEPAVGRVGLTEAEARAAHGAEVRVYTQDMAGVDRAVTVGETEGFVALVAGAKGKLLGATAVGPAAGEMINELALVMRQGLGLDAIAATTHVYPTIALALQQAAGKYSIEKVVGSGGVRLLRRLGG